MTSSSPAPSLLGLLLLGLPARAQEPAASPPAAAPPPAAERAAEPDETLIVYDELEVQRRRNELTAALRAEGYLEGKRRGDRTIYRPEDAWKPSVEVHEDGLLTLHRSPVRFEVPGRRENMLNALWCLPPFTPMCVRIGGQVVSEARLDAAKGRVLDAVHPASERWRTALMAQRLQDRLDQELPGRLERMWASGAPLEGDGPPLLTAAQRRQAILAYWASRADSPEGHEVARVIQTFIQEVLMKSEQPPTDEEIAAANQLAGGLRRLERPATDPG